MGSDDDFDDPCLDGFVENLWEFSGGSLALAIEIARKAVICHSDDRDYYVFFGRDKEENKLYWKECVEQLVENIERESETRVAETGERGIQKIIIPKTEVAERLVNLLACHDIEWDIVQELGRMPLQDALVRLLAELL
ncbi:MAG: hypothetical protein QW356_02035 [Candidatus Hadarchaeales archaeon]